MLTIRSTNDSPLALLEQLGNLVQGSGNCLEKALCEKNALDEAAVKAETYVQRGQKLTGELIIKLNKTFITPLDREDLGKIALELKGLLTGSLGAIQMLVLLKPQMPLPQEGLRLGMYLVAAMTDLNLAVSLVKKVEKDGQPLLRCCERVNQSAYNGGRCYREALAALFSWQEIDLAEFLKWKEVFGELAKALHECARAADRLKAMVLKYG